MVRSSGFKIPEDQIRKREEQERHKQDSDKEAFLKELEQQRYKIFNDLNLHSGEQVHEIHLEGV